MAKKLKFGRAFNDELEKVKFKYHHYGVEGKGDKLWQDNLISPEVDFSETKLTSPWRKVLFPIFILIAFSLLFTRLFHLQIVEGKDHKTLADSNRIQVKIIHAPRGVIYDRNGQILAQNEPGFRLLEASSSGTMVTLLSRDQVLDMEVNNNPKIKDLEIDNTRSYALGEKTAHILGYLGPITEEELKDPDYKGYNIGDRVGRGGIEQAFEKVLRGVDGGEIIEIDAEGKKIRTLRTIEPLPGQNVYLTIDASLQSLGFDKLKEGLAKAKSCCGALVIQDPNTGEVLSLVSYPSFDTKNLAASLAAPNSPLLNRAISGTYPPGSTFKIASSLAGLASGKITPQTVYEDTGIMHLGPYTFANWFFTQNGRKEGPVDMVKALKRSNDIYFYQLGQAIGEKDLGDFSKKLGLGKTLGIDIPGEEPGLIPDDSWKQENYGDVWYPGDTLHMAIGQGFVLSTPLQINNLISLVAASGKQYPPHLVSKITSPSGFTVKQYKYDGSGIDFKKDDLNVIKEGLGEVPKTGGTAWPFFNFPIPTAGKTGTAEYGGEDKTHAWYTSYAPIDKPQISATVLLEGGGEGSTDASPIIKEIYRWYFSNDKKNLLKDLSPISATEAAT